MSVIIFLLINYVLLSISLYFLFEKVDQPSWKGLVPFYNFMVWAQVIGYPLWRVIFILVPIVNIFIYATMAVRMVRSFDKLKFWHSALAVIGAPIFFFYLAFSKDEKYVGPNYTMEQEYKEKLKEAKDNKKEREFKKLEARNPYKKSGSREWAEAIIFAVFAAAFIRMFLIEAYVIPTSSMEGSLMVGDFLFVSKANYGIRMPQTVAMLPLLHNRAPGGLGESYLEKPQLPYKRLKALEKIDRNDPVVFNYPEGDSVYIWPERTYSIYDYRRGQISDARKVQQIKTGRKKLVTRPMDKKDHYIKRCIALPGDSLQIINKQVYVNGQKAENPRYLQYFYFVTFPNGAINTKNFTEWGISTEDQGVINQQANQYIMVLNEEQKEKVQAMDPNINIDIVDIAELERRMNQNPNKVFPHDLKHFPNWTKDSYGPIWIPKKGETVQLTPSNIALYERIINVYEDNDYQRRGDKFYINGKEATEYTFKMDYYWMMGDNRHNSEDARIWGFVPENHVVGKPLFVWMSIRENQLTKGINFSRIFRSVESLSK